MRAMYRAIFVCSLGSALEWYDFSLFGVLAPVIADIFFPTGNHWTSILLVFVTFASGFIMRPMGAVYFGRMGDRRGRKAALALTIILMAMSTSLIGLIPSYEKMGFISPLLVVLMRLLQGFSASGEYPAAIALMTELAPEQKRGYYGSFSVFGVVAGIFLSSLVMFVLTQFISPATMHTWGWRVAFLISAPLGLLGFYLRTKMQESPVFLALQHQHQVVDTPMKALLRYQYKPALIIFSLFAFSTVSFYTVFIYINAYLTHLQLIPLRVLALVNLLSIGILLSLIPVFGKLSDRVERRKLIRLGVVGLMVFSYPLFSLLMHPSLVNILIGLIGFVALLAIVIGPMAAFSAELMPGQLRVSGISLGLNLSASLLGGTAPLLVACLAQLLHSVMVPCYYLMICGGLVWMLLENENVNQAARYKFETGS